MLKTRTIIAGTNKICAKNPAKKVAVPLFGISSPTRPAVKNKHHQGRYAQVHREKNQFYRFRDNLSLASKIIIKNNGDQ